ADRQLSVIRFLRRKLLTDHQPPPRTGTVHLVLTFIDFGVCSKLESDPRNGSTAARNALRRSAISPDCACIKRPRFETNLLVSYLGRLRYLLSKGILFHEFSTIRQNPGILALVIDAGDLQSHQVGS